MTNSSQTTLSATILVGALALAGCKRDAPEQERQEPGEVEVVVHVDKVVRATLRAYVEAYGVVEPDPGGGATAAGVTRLTTSVAGIVTAVPVREGQRVASGDLIVKLDDRTAAASVQRAQHALNFALKVMSREERLKATDGTSEKAVQEASRQVAAAEDDLAAARIQLLLTQLTTPIEGTVSRIFVQPGQAVDFNTIVAEVVDLKRLVVAANVPAEESAILKVGQPVELFTARAATPGLSGTVAFVGQRIDPMTRAVAVRASFPADAGLLPGQLLRVRIVGEERPGRLAVPVAGLVRDGQGNAVIAVVEGGKAIRKQVQVGLRDSGLVEVAADGLSEGQTVVTVGAYGLPNETRVRVLDK